MGVGAFDPALDPQGDAVVQGAGLALQGAVQPLQRGGAAAQQGGAAQLVQQGQDPQHPRQGAEQPHRHQVEQRPQQVVAPQHREAAQHAPQQRVGQADITVDVEAVARVIPPGAVVQPLQDLGGKPFHHSSHRHTAQEQIAQRIPQFVKADGHDHRGKAVNVTKGPCGKAAVHKAPAPGRRDHRLGHPAQKRIDHVQQHEVVIPRIFHDLLL